MKYEVVESGLHRDLWHVEMIDDEGRVFVAVFSGPDAEQRAVEYADWKNAETDAELLHNGRN
jgi:hypothetical protein